LNCKITVFTPVYNRAHLIEKLYRSLLDQKFKDFEWVIVDDGSNDNLQEKVKQFVEENEIKIKYQRQSNGGKHRAINTGLEISSGDLFFIVDSDDYLTDNALQMIGFHWDEITEKEEFCGISGLKGFSDLEIVGTADKDYIQDCSYLDYRYHKGIKGDKAEVFVTKILKENKFPEIEGENFITEAIIWDRLGSMYKMRWVNEIIYICEYLEDGLTKKSEFLRVKNIKGTLLYYSTLIKYQIPLKYKGKTSINYYRFLFQSKLPKHKYFLKINPFLNILGIMGGFAMSLFDQYKQK
jgi:glycosyltransferase involved in cell wall biosynthesis